MYLYVPIKCCSLVLRLPKSRYYLLEIAELREDIKCYFYAVNSDETIQELLTDGVHTTLYESVIFVSHTSIDCVLCSCTKITAQMH